MAMTEEWVLGVLEQNGPQTLDYLAESVPSAKWAQPLLAVDRLSRSGDITLRHRGRAEYVVDIMRHRKKVAS